MTEVVEPPVVEAPAVVEPPVVVPPLGREEPKVEPPTKEALPDWMESFADDLKGDAALKPFAGKTPADLAQAYVETKKMVGDRIQLPKAEDPDSFVRFAAAVRPEKAEDYTIEVPEGQDGALAEAMRPVFHDAGLHPMQVEKLVAANNAYVAAQQEALDAAGRQELADLEAGMGKAEFAAAKQATNAWLTRMGIPVKFDTDLARLVGAGNSVRILFDIAARTGELGKVGDSDMALALGTMTPQQAREASAKLDAVELRDPNSAASKKMDEYAAIIAAGTEKR